MANTTGINETINCKNGFYFGDPCYALRDDLYQEWINWGEEREKKEGRWCNDGKFVFGGKEIMLVDSTAYGDGCYDGSEMSYGVDAGCLAVIPLEFCDTEKNMDGLVMADYVGKVSLVTDGDTGTFHVRDKNHDDIECVRTAEEEEEEYDDIPW